jgi:hypothetical protein
MGIIDIALLWVTFGIGFVTGAYFLGSARQSNADLDGYFLKPPSAQRPPTSGLVH